MLMPVLLQNGYAWTTASSETSSELQSFFSLLYGPDTELERHELILDKETGVDFACLGNPLTGVLLQQFMGTSKDAVNPAWLSVQRVWVHEVETKEEEKEAKIVVVGNTHTGEGCLQALRTGRHSVPPLDWSAKPHVTRKFSIGRRKVIQDGVNIDMKEKDGRGYLIVTECTALRAEKSTRWFTWSPKKWCSSSSSSSATAADVQQTYVMREQKDQPPKRASAAEEMMALQKLKTELEEMDDPSELEKFSMCGLVRRDLVKDNPILWHMIREAEGDETGEYVYISGFVTDSVVEKRSSVTTTITVRHEAIVPGSVRGWVSHLLHCLLFRLHRLPTEGRHWAQRPSLPYGPAVITEQEGCLEVDLPEPFYGARIGFNAKWSADDPNHILTIKDCKTGIPTTCMTFTGLDELIKGIGTILPLQTESILQRRPATIVVQVDLSRGAIPPVINGCLCGLLVMLNPLPFLEEVVALATQITADVFKDNRTLGAIDLELCAKLQTMRRTRFWDDKPNTVRRSCPSLGRLQQLPMAEKIRVTRRRPAMELSKEEKKKRKRRRCGILSEDEDDKKLLHEPPPGPLYPLTTVIHVLPEVRRRLTFSGTIKRLNAFQSRIGRPLHTVVDCDYWNL